MDEWVVVEPDLAVIVFVLLVDTESRISRDNHVIRKNVRNVDR
jgi:hypothetical protein